MLKKLSVVCVGTAVCLMTAGAASAQSATQDVTDKTKAAAQKTADVTTDAAITSAVKTKLLADTTVGGLKIDVDTKNGVVTLTGPVHSTAERTEAVRLARETSGVKRVVSKLTVEATGTSGRKDDTKVVIKDDTKDTAAKVKDTTEKAAEKTKDGAVKAGKATAKGTEKAADATKDAAVKTLSLIHI